MPTSQLFHSSLRTPGETLVIREAWINGVSRGVQDGLFAVGEKAGDELIPSHFKNAPPEITLDNDEVIIQPKLIRESITPEDILHDYLTKNETISTSHPFEYNPQSTNEPRPLREAWETAIREGVRKGTFGIGDKTDDEITLRAFRQELSTITLGDNEILIQASRCTELIVEPPRPDPPDESEGVAPPDDGEVDPLPGGDPKKTISIRFTLPQGKVSNVAQHLNQLHSNFQNMQT